MENKVIVVKDKRRIGARPWLVRWWGEYDAQTGKQKKYCKSFARRKDAEAFAEEKETEFETGMLRDQHDITLGQLCKKFKSTRRNSLSKSSRRGYDETISHLKDYFSPTMSVKRIRKEDAEEFISKLKPVDERYIAKGKQLADSSVHKHLRQAKKIFATAQEWGYVKVNPFKKISLGKIRKRPWHYITVEQFNAVLGKTSSLRDTALYGVMYWCGLRYGEAVNLLWDGRNIDFENNRLTIFNRSGTKDIPSFNVKDYEARSVPMNRWVVEILIKLQEESEEGCPFVFLTTRRYEVVKKRWHKLVKAGQSRDWENRYMLNGVLKNFKARIVAAGIKTNLKINLHCLRKSWATNLANSGKVPIHTLKELGGWSHVKTCEEFYLQSSDANRERACEVLNELAGIGEKVGI